MCGEHGKFHFIYGRNALILHTTPGSKWTHCLFDEQDIKTEDFSQVAMIMTLVRACLMVSHVQHS
jgi:hypothetical protein